MARNLRLAWCLILTMAGSAAGQDANYWAIQYGPVGQLLGGQMIGDARDLSATYYNPGGLALEDRATFLLSTESFQVEQFRTKPVAELDLLDATTTRLGAAPTLVAGSFPRRWLGERTRLAWSFLTRQDLQVRLTRRLQNPFDVPGIASAAELYLDQDVNESWGGLTLSRRLSETVGVGATLYGIYRGQRSRNEVNAQALGDTEATLSILAVQDFSYYHLRTLAKLGVAWQREGWLLGLNLTTPSLGLFGSGRVGLTESLVGVDGDGNGFPDPPALKSQTDDGLSAQYRSSWAIGAGVSWDRGHTRWHLSAEWFAPVDRFDVVRVSSQDGAQPPGLTQELQSVLNAGLGVEHDFGNELVLYGAGLTDFSASVGDPTANVAVSNWNLYHLSGGVKFAVAGSRFTLGATYTFGGKERPLFSVIPPAVLPEGSSEWDISYRRIVVLLGFLFGGQ